MRGAVGAFCGCPRSPSSLSPAGSVEGNFGAPNRGHFLRFSGCPQFWLRKRGSPGWLFGGVIGWSLGASIGEDGGAALVPYACSRWALAPRSPLGVADPLFQDPFGGRGSDIRCPSTTLLCPSEEAWRDFLSGSAGARSGWDRKGSGHGSGNRGNGEMSVAPVDFV